MHLHGVYEGPEGPTKIGDVGAWVDECETHMWLLDMRLKRGGLRLYTAKHLRDPVVFRFFAVSLTTRIQLKSFSANSKNLSYTRTYPTEQPVSQFSFLDQLLRICPHRVSRYIPNLEEHTQKLFRIPTMPSL
jgi:hypothetical protein